MALGFSCCRFIQELITHLGQRSSTSSPCVLKMWRLAPEIVAVIEYDGQLEVECVFYYNSSSWSRTKPDPEPIERVYEAPHCLANFSSYQAMTPPAMLALAMKELRATPGQAFYPHPLKMTVPEPIRAMTLPHPEQRLVPLPA